MADMNNLIDLVRTSYEPKGTRGVLAMPDGWACFTVELPWRGNKVALSCIPEGEYPLKLRRSHAVERATGGEYLSGWEVTEVPGRTYIMIHPANYPPELEGCIAPGRDKTDMDGYPAVGSSRDAFDKLMSELEGGSEWTLRISAQ